MISIILMKKILSLFLMMFMGFLLVKSGKLRSQDSKIINILTAYVIFPCIILSSFNITYDRDILMGMLLSLVASIVMFALQQIFVAAFKRPLKIQPTEHACILYPNTGNLIIPLVGYILGAEYIIYCSVYMCFFTLLMWSHGKAILSGESRLDIRFILTNINIIALFVGLLMFLFNLHFPAPVQEAVDTIGGITGPVVMLIMGMLIADVNMQKLKLYKRLPLVVALRMLVLPLLIIIVYKLAHLENFCRDAEGIMLIAVMSASAPTASTITQLAQLFGADEAYANLITLVGTLVCIATMPLMVLIYQSF